MLVLDASVTEVNFIDHTALAESTDQSVPYMCIKLACYKAQVKKGLHQPKECMEFKQYFSKNEPGNF